MALGTIDLGGQLDRVWSAIVSFAENFARIDLPYLAAALRSRWRCSSAEPMPGRTPCGRRTPVERCPSAAWSAPSSSAPGMNGILPARGGDALKIVLAKRSVRGAAYPAIISSFAVLAPFDTGIGLVVLLYAITQGLLPAAPRLPELPAFDISFWAANPQLLLLTITVIGIGLVVLVAVLARRVESFWQTLEQGVAIFREPRRYLRQVLAWQAAGWLLRFASFWLFLDAFHIGGSVDNVLLVMCVQAITGALPFTPGGAGAQQALLVVALDGPTYAAVLAYSVGQQVAVTVWSVAIAFDHPRHRVPRLGPAAADPRGPRRPGRPGARDLTKGDLGRSVCDWKSRRPPRPRPQDFAYSTRICLPSSLVPSRRSSASLACSSGSSTNEKRSRTRMESIASSGITAPSVSAQRRLSSSMPLRVPRLTNSFTLPSPVASRSRSGGDGRSPSWSRRRGRGACSIRSSGGSHSPILVLASRSIRGISSLCLGVTKVIARPVRPTRPVRPIRCT